MGKLRIDYRFALPLLLITPYGVSAQCLSGNCYAFADASSLQICEGQSVTLTSEGGSAALYNNFNNQTVGVGWITNNIDVMFSNPCGAGGADGTTYLWFGNTSGAGERTLTTLDFNLTGGGNISFDLRFSIQGDNSPCEGPDLANEGAYFQYSTNYGSSWVTIFYFDPNIGSSGGSAASPYTTWHNYSYPIPAAAQTPCTRFRWYQEEVSGELYDHWGLDNVFIGGPPPNPGSVVFQWMDGTAAGAPRTVTPSDDTQYILMYGNSNDTCYDTVNVVVHDVPVAAISATPMQACMGTPVNFNASASDAGSTPISSYKWIFNNSWVVNQTTTVPTTSFSYPITGTFNTAVIVTAGICSDTAIVPVTVSVPPTVSFLYPVQVCEGQTVNLNASGSTVPAPGTILSYDWDYGNDGSVDVSGANPAVSTVFSAQGVVPVKLTVVSGAGCQASLIHNVNVFDIPEADFSFNNACIGALSAFQNLSGGTATQYAWDFAGLGTATGQTPSFGFPGAGLYVVTMVAGNAGVCYDTAQHTVEIKNTVAADFSFNEPCTLTGEYADLSSVPSASDGVITSWAWNFGDGTTDTYQNTSHTYAQNGVYSVTLIVGTDMGCWDTLTQNVPRYAVPVADFSAEPVCLGQLTTLVNTSSVPSGVIAASYWNYGDGNTSGDYGPTFHYDTFGTFPVSLTVETENGCRDSITMDYQVYPQPVADFEFEPSFTDMLSPDVQFNDLSQYAESWYWTIGNAGTVTGQNPLFTFTASGSYDVTLTVENQYGCKATVTYAYTVLPAYNFYVPSAFTPFNGDHLNEYFRVYHTGVKEFRFMIFNSWGQELYSTIDPDFHWDGRMKGKALPQGTYVYKAWVRNIEGQQFQYSGHFVMTY